MTHLNYETLLNYIEDRLSAAEKVEVDAHLAEACEACEHRLGLLRRALRRAAEDRTVAPPHSVLKRAIDIPLTRERPAQVRPWERMIAALTFDSHQQLSPAYTRGAARERQLLFSAGGMDIDLQIKPGLQGYDLFGQILQEKASQDGVSVFVSLQENGGQILKAAETDPTGAFVFRAVPLGRYDLIFDLDDQEVTVPAIEVSNG